MTAPSHDGHHPRHDIPGPARGHRGAVVGPPAVGPSGWFPRIPTDSLSVPEAGIHYEPFPSLLPLRRPAAAPAPVPWRTRRRLVILLLLLALIALLTAVRSAWGQVNPIPRPAGVTDSAIAWGKVLYHGSANCSACHGDAGRGTDRGPNLTGAIWLHGPGTYAWLIQQVTHGVPASQSMSGDPMPMRGWTPMNDPDVQAVAAYVWSISHPPQPPPPAKPKPS